MKETYTIHDLCLITGLTDRTLRNHIADGYLKGQKTNGAWQFTKQQVDDFFNAPQGWPGIHAKKNAIVYDFLRNKSKKARKMCVILDLPGEDGAETGAFFCRLISNRGRNELFHRKRRRLLFIKNKKSRHWTAFLTLYYIICVTASRFPK